MTRVLVAVTAALAVLVGWCAPAVAVEPVGTLAIPDGVLYAECGELPFDYAVTGLAEGEETIVYAVSAVAPDGTEQASGSADYPGGPSGTGSLMFCGSEDPGLYTAQPWVTTRLGLWVSTTYLTPVTFSMRRPTTTTTYAARVVLQHYQNGQWTRVKHSRDTTTERGRAGIWILVGARSKGRYRAVTFAGARYDGSVSGVVRLHPRDRP